MKSCFSLWHVEEQGPSWTSKDEKCKESQRHNYKLSSTNVETFCSSFYANSFSDTLTIFKFEVAWEVFCFLCKCCGEFEEFIVAWSRAEWIVRLHGEKWIQKFSGIRICWRGKSLSLKFISEWYGNINWLSKRVQLIQSTFQTNYKLDRALNFHSNNWKTFQSRMRQICHKSHKRDELKQFERCNVKFIANKSWNYIKRLKFSYEIWNCSKTQILSIQMLITMAPFFYYVIIKPYKSRWCGNHLRKSRHLRLGRQISTFPTYSLKSARLKQFLLLNWFWLILKKKVGKFEVND